MVHPDYQYSPLLVPALAAMIAYGEYDLVLGSRILARTRSPSGMPRYKYVANRSLTFVENILLARSSPSTTRDCALSAREVLEALPL